MKAFAFVLLCALAAVQGRYHALSTRSAAELGENPWVVHLRLAVATSGLLETCGGSLIDSRWVLTSKTCLVDSRFIWVRYGVVNVINPELVTESSAVRTHATSNLGLININRYVEQTSNIGFISPNGQPGESGIIVIFGNPDGPGEVLNRYVVEVINQEDGSLAVSSDEVQFSTYDIGSAVVGDDGAQFGILVEESGSILETAPLLPWIEEQTGVSFSS